MAISFGYANSAFHGLCSGSGGLFVSGKTWKLPPRTAKAQASASRSLAQGSVPHLLKTRKQPPITSDGRLTDFQLEWYVQEAITWLKTDHDPLSDGTYLLRFGPTNRDFDPNAPIIKRQSPDGSTVTVSLQRRWNGYSPRWIEIKFDTRTGEVKSFSEPTIVE